MFLDVFGDFWAVGWGAGHPMVLGVGYEGFEPQQCLLLGIAKLLSQEGSLGRPLDAVAKTFAPVLDSQANSIHPKALNGQAKRQGRYTQEGGLDSRRSLMFYLQFSFILIGWLSCWQTQLMKALAAQVHFTVFWEQDGWSSHTGWCTSD